MYLSCINGCISSLTLIYNFFQFSLHVYHSVVMSFAFHLTEEPSSWFLLVYCNLDFVIKTENLVLAIPKAFNLGEMSTHLSPHSASNRNKMSMKGTLFAVKNSIAVYYLGRASALLFRFNCYVSWVMDSCEFKVMNTGGKR